MKLNNIFKPEEVKQPENESEKEKDRLFLKNTLSSEEKEELRNQLILLMVPIINWKEYPGFRNSEWAISIIKGRHMIEDLKLKHSSLDKNYIDDIREVCFKRAKELVRAEIGNKTSKNQIVNSLTLEEVFECDYTLSIPKSNYLSKTSFGKNFPVFITLFVVLFGLSANLHNLSFISFPEIFALIFFLISIVGLFSACFMTFLLTDDMIFKLLLGIACLSIFALFVTTVVYAPQRAKPSTSTVSQSSPSVKPSPGPKSRVVAPSKSSQRINQNRNN